MRFLEMGFAFAVIAFVVTNALLSVVTALFWRGARRFRFRADALFLIRVFPALASAAFVLGVVLPAYWMFEPRETSERAGPALGVFVVVASGLLVAGMWRVLAGWLEARRMERAWRSRATRAKTLRMPARVYRVPTAMPLAALVGVFRPRLFVSGQFFDSLAAGERQAVLDHEAAHLRALDNLKRAFVKLAPDCLSFLPAGREIEAAWTIATEEEADDLAAGYERAKALDLAGALIKASRFAPRKYASVSSFCEDATIVRRVARLLDDRASHRAPVSRAAPRILLALALLTAVGLLAGPGLRPVYTLSEAAVQFLSYAAWQ